jgi:hypothetical protein
LADVTINYKGRRRDDGAVGRWPDLSAQPEPARA